MWRFTVKVSWVGEEHHVVEADDADAATDLVIDGLGERPGPDACFDEGASIIDVEEEERS